MKKTFAGSHVETRRPWQLKTLTWTGRTTPTIQLDSTYNFVCRWNCLIQRCPFHFKVSICLPFCLNPLLFVSARSFTCHQPYPVLFISTPCFRFNPVFLSLILSFSVSTLFFRLNTVLPFQPCLFVFIFFLFRFNPLLSPQHCPFVSTLCFGLKLFPLFGCSPFLSSQPVLLVSSSFRFNAILSLKRFPCRFSFSPDIFSSQL